MKLNSNKHLDDLLAAARREDPIISEENARDLLAKGEHMQPSPFIFSTKGIIMSSIGLSLAAFTAYIALSGSPQVPFPQSASVSVPASNLFAHSMNSITDEPKKSDAKAVKKIVTVRNSDEVLTPAVPPTPPVPPVPSLPPVPQVISTPVKVTGIKPMPLAPEKYAKMGVSKKDDGTVSFSQKNENGRIFTMSFPKNTWGIVIGDEKQHENIDAPRFAPLIVTDTKGNKRLMQFTSEKNGVKTRGMEIQSRADDADIDAGELSNVINNALKLEGALQVGGKDGDIDMLKLGLDSNDLKDLNDALRTEITLNVHSDTNSSVKMPRRKGVQVFVNTDKREIDTTTDGKPHKMIVMNKTVRRIDSTMQNAAETVRRAEKEIEHVIKKMHLEHLDSANGKLQSQIKELETEIEHESGNEARFDGTIKSLALLDMHELEEQAGELNRLVPILVRNATSEHLNKEEGITYDDGLIFWYDPQKELLSTLPEASNSGVAPSSNEATATITEVSLFPNPARNRSTVRLTVAEPRNLAFSIHDLLGKKVIEGGTLSAATGGSYVHELNLSELSAGVYLLVITTDKGEQSMQRLVIEK